MTSDRPLWRDVLSFSSQAATGIAIWTIIIWFFGFAHVVAFLVEAGLVLFGVSIIVRLLTRGR